MIFVLRCIMASTICVVFILLVKYLLAKYFLKDGDDDV